MIAVDMKVACFSGSTRNPWAKALSSGTGKAARLGMSQGRLWVIAHELDHAFGGKHHHSEDDERERKGNLMGLGSRGFRGYFRPDLTDDRCVLSKIDAQSLYASQFIDVRELEPKRNHFLRP